MNITLNIYKLDNMNTLNTYKINLILIIKYFSFIMYRQIKIKIHLPDITRLFEFNLSFT